MYLMRLSNPPKAVQAMKNRRFILQAPAPLAWPWMTKLFTLDSHFKNLFNTKRGCLFNCNLRRVIRPLIEGVIAIEHEERIGRVQPNIPAHELGDLPIKSTSPCLDSTKSRPWSSRAMQSNSSSGSASFRRMPKPLARAENSRFSSSLTYHSKVAAYRFWLASALWSPQPPNLRHRSMYDSMFWSAAALLDDVLLYAKSRRALPGIGLPPSFRQVPRACRARLLFKGLRLCSN